VCWLQFFPGRGHLLLSLFLSFLFFLSYLDCPSSRSNGTAWTLYRQCIPPPLPLGQHHLLTEPGAVHYPHHPWPYLLTWFFLTHLSSSYWPQIGIPPGFMVFPFSSFPLLCLSSFCVFLGRLTHPPFFRVCLPGFCVDFPTLCLVLRRETAQGAGSSGTAPCKPDPFLYCPA